MSAPTPSRIVIACFIVAALMFVLLLVSAIS